MLLLSNGLPLTEVRQMPLSSIGEYHLKSFAKAHVFISFYSFPGRRWRTECRVVVLFLLSFVLGDVNDVVPVSGIPSSKLIYFSIVSPYHQVWYQLPPVCHIWLYSERHVTVDFVL